MTSQWFDATDNWEGYVVVLVSGSMIRSYSLNCQALPECVVVKQRLLFAMLLSFLGIYEE